MADARDDKRESYDQDALDEASRELHMFFLREGSRYGTKACEEIGRMFMTAYLKTLPSHVADSPAAKNEGDAALRLLAEVADAMGLSLGDSESVAKMRPLVLARLESVPSTTPQKPGEPQESPLAWAVFVHLDPQGYDYRIFPDEREADDVAGENPENGEPVPLYRASAFAASATRRIPQFIDVGTMYEICRSDNGEWTLRLKDGDDRVHVRDLNKHEKSFVDAALTAMGATDGGKETP